MPTATKALVASLVLSASLFGCQAAPQVDTPTLETFGTASTSRLSTATTTVLAHLSFSYGGYNVLSTSTLTAYNLSDVYQVTLTLLKYNGSAYAAIGSGVTKTIASGALSAPVPISNLSMGTTYKVVAKAYDKDNNEIDTGLDSVNSATFTTPQLVSGGSSPQQNTAGADNVSTDTTGLAVPVQLKDKVFAGQASSANGVTISNGTIVNTKDQESF